MHYNVEWELTSGCFCKCEDWEWVYGMGMGMWVSVSCLFVVDSTNSVHDCTSVAEAMGRKMMMMMMMMVMMVLCVGDSCECSVSTQHCS